GGVIGVAVGDQDGRDRTAQLLGERDEPAEMAGVVRARIDDDRAAAAWLVPHPGGRPVGGHRARGGCEQAGGPRGGLAGVGGRRGLAGGGRGWWGRPGWLELPGWLGPVIRGPGRCRRARRSAAGSRRSGRSAPSGRLSTAAARPPP